MLRGTATKTRWQPTIGQTAKSMTLGHTAVDCPAVVGCSPRGFANRALGKLLGDLTVLVVASFAEFDVARLAAGDDNRRGTGDGGQPRAGRITVTDEERQLNGGVAAFIVEQGHIMSDALTIRPV